MRVLAGSFMKPVRNTNANIGVVKNSVMLYRWMLLDIYIERDDI